MGEKDDDDDEEEEEGKTMAKVVVSFCFQGKFLGFPSCVVCCTGQKQDVIRQT